MTANPSIAQLRRQLLDLGYYPFQLDRIAEDSIGRKDLENLSAEQAEVMFQVLSDYVRFARRCQTGSGPK